MNEVEETSRATLRYTLYEGATEHFLTTIIARTVLTDVLEIELNLEYLLQEDEFNLPGHDPHVTNVKVLGVDVDRRTVLCIEFASTGRAAKSQSPFPPPWFGEQT